MKRKNITLFVLITALIITSITFIYTLFNPYRTNDIASNNAPLNQSDYQLKKILDPTPTKSISIQIEEVETIIEGKKVVRYLYTDKDLKPYGAGMPIVVNVGDRLNITVTNHTQVATNIHWHGLSVPNDQDGPGILINPSQTFHYSFAVPQSGTYWYHSHERPVRDQVDMGMYAPFIVKDDIDTLYDKDYILMLDDWSVNDSKGHMRGHTEKIGNTLTVNGATSNQIEPIILSSGDIAKLRFINSSTALTHTLSFPVPVRVTHTDGRGVSRPYITSVLNLAPGERYDVELQMDQTSSQTLYILDNRDVKIPIQYTYQSNGVLKESPYQAPTVDTILKEAPSIPNIEMKLSDNMGMNGHEWTINNEVFPHLESFKIEKDKLYTIRFINQGMHKMNHPMHIHGAHFAVKSINGQEQVDVIYKDTIDIPYGTYVDVAIRFDKLGEWMVHCHILDHEDGGMMTSIVVE